MVGSADVVAIAGAVFGILVGWALKTWTDAWSWRRPQLLDAYVEVLSAADLFSLSCSRAWGTGQGDRDQEWLEQAERARADHLAVDRAIGRLRLVGTYRAAEVAIRLFVACDRMYRRAVAAPPTSADKFQQASNEMALAYEHLVNQGRSELTIRRWLERLGQRESIGALSTRLIDELKKTDPYPPQYFG